MMKDENVSKHWKNKNYESLQLMNQIYNQGRDKVVLRSRSKSGSRRQVIGEEIRYRVYLQNYKRLKDLHKTQKSYANTNLANSRKKSVKQIVFKTSKDKPKSFKIPFKAMYGNKSTKVSNHLK